jgi:hypothetical protein
MLKKRRVRRERRVVCMSPAIPWTGSHLPGQLINAAWKTIAKMPNPVFNGIIFIYAAVMCLEGNIQS